MAAPQVTFYVILPPQPPDVGSAIRPIARLLKMEDDAVRALLLTKTYAVVARFAKRANAEGLRSQLHAFGIETLVLGDQDIRGYLFVWAKTASSGQGGMAFKDFNDKPLFCPWNDILGAMVLHVRCIDGTTAMIIDVHRRSTTITPRLDVSLFDFPTLLSQRGAGVEDFLAELESRGSITVNRLYMEKRDEITRSAHDFGSEPGVFPPSDDVLPSIYDPEDLLAANFFSVVMAERTKVHAKA